MWIILLPIVVALLAGGLGFYAYKRYEQIRQERIAENEYDIAVTVWNYARLLKQQLHEAFRKREGVIDFQKIAVPHSRGYKVALELAGAEFRVYAVPDAHNKTGRMSFYTDQSLKVRAGDHLGERATAQDEEFPGVGGP